MWNNAGGISDSGGIRRHIAKDHSTCAYLRVMTDANIAQYFCSGTQNGVILHGGMPFDGADFVKLSRCPQCDTVINGYVISDNGGFSDYNAASVIDKNMFSEMSAGMDIYLCIFAGAGADEAGKQRVSA